MAKTELASAKLPQTQKFGKHTLTIRLLSPEDTELLKDAILRFTNSLPPSDLVFLRMDITQDEVVAEWMENIRLGRTVTVLAEEDGRIVGYGNLHTSGLHWTRHIGEIRILVGADQRGAGLGQTLAGHLIALAREQGLIRVVAHIPSNQPRVRAMFEDLEFVPEALLTDWLKDRNDRTHDLIIMSRQFEG